MHAKFVLVGNKIQRRTKIPTNGNGWTSGPVGSLGHEVIVWKEILKQTQDDKDCLMAKL